MLVTPLSGVSGRMIVRGTRRVRRWAEPIRFIEQEAVARADARLGAAYPQSGPEKIGSAEIFFEVATRPPELAIFGAGHDAVPVAQLAWTLGFTVTVIDVREAFLTTGPLSRRHLVWAHFSEFADRVKLPVGSFVLVMNHHVERDQESLRFSLESDASYIGIARTSFALREAVAGLAQQGYMPAPSKLSRVRSPVGLSLGAETPQEVAVVDSRRDPGDSTRL